MQTIANSQGFLAPKEVALLLGVHTATIYRAVAAGKLPVVRLGARTSIRIPCSALEPKETT